MQESKKIYTQNIYHHYLRYIPAISQIWIKTDSFPIKLKGIGIGDVFTDP